jgi:cysteine-rich repeat protein
MIDLATAGRFADDATMRRSNPLLACVYTAVLGMGASGCLLDASAFDPGTGAGGPGTGGSTGQGAGSSTGGGGIGGGTGGASTTSTTSTTQSTGGTGGIGGTGGTGGTTGTAGTGGTGGSPVVCGDGNKEGDEECDLGGANSDMGICLTSCHTAKCGDGFVLAGVEECDVGAANSDSGGCLADCHAAKCGDGKLHTGVETCDDGNAFEGDGCFDCKTDCGCPGCMAGTACPSCGPVDGSVTYKNPATDHCYVIVPTEVTWSAARTACQAWGGDLAALSTTAELTDVMKPAVGAVITGSGSQRGWTGGNDMATEGTYVWSNGETWMYQAGIVPWKAGEPSATEDCAVLGTDNGTTYNFRGNDCGAPHTYLCERTIQ